jgi:hypothetical protein
MDVNVTRESISDQVRETIHQFYGLSAAQLFLKCMVILQSEIFLPIDR